MINFKKNTALALVLIFCIGLFSCGGGYSKSSAGRQKKMHRINKRHGHPSAVSSKRRR